MTLSSSTPIALLPVRIETRFADDADGTVVLRVRIFPDQIHVDAHDPRPTQRENQALAGWLASARDLAAWRDLIARVGARRAAYLATANEVFDPELERPNAWSQAPRARLLPDRWQVVVEQQDGAVQTWRATTADVKPDLAVGLSPDDPGEISAGSIELSADLAWLADYGAAVDAGMAVTVRLATSVVGPLRVIVFGVRDRAPASEATALADLLDAHHFSDGLSFLTAGTPTNHTAEEAAPWSSARATPEDSYAIEREGGLAGAGSVGEAMATALGVPAAVFDRVDAGAPADRDWSAANDQTAAMHRALWPATLGYFLEQMLDGALLIGETVEQVRDLFVGSVRSRGPLPTLRIGRDPYGVLPILPLAAWRESARDRVDTGMVSILRALRLVWTGEAARAPRLTAAATDEDYARVLAMAPVSTTFTGRSVVGAAYASYLYDFLRRPLDRPWWHRQRELAVRGWQKAKLPDRNTRLSRASYDAAHFAIAGAVAQASLVGDRLEPNYLATLVGASLDTIRGAPELVGGTPLLYRLARHATMASFLAAARRDLAAQTPPRNVLEPEMIGLSTGLEPPWTWLDETASIGGTLRAALSGKAAAALADPAFVDCWQGLATLADLSPRRLDALTREALDLASHRLDAWITAVAWRRLRALRDQQSGIHVGAYGMVENVRRASGVAGADGGYIHVPSLAHAPTAALLRSGYLAHRDNPQTPFAVDLRSARVRAAREVLEAIHAGESLGAAIGRRVERAVLEAHPPLWQHLRGLRIVAAAPGTVFPERKTVDGVGLVKLAHPPSHLPWGEHGLPAAGTTQATALATIVADAEAALDAVGDLLVAESIHQLACGNPGRASGVLDALALGGPAPAELSVAEVPVAGIGLSHRVLALVPADAGADGWSASRRASAEPALEAWCGHMLGTAASYQLAVRYLATDGTVLASPTIGLDALGCSALDLVGAVARDELIARIRDVAWSARPPEASQAIDVAIDSSPIAGHRSLDDALLLGAAVADALASGRAARAIDLAPTSDQPDVEPAIDEAVVAALEARGDDRWLTSALDALASDPRDGLRQAASLGVAGAIPAMEPTAWPAQVAAAAAELTARRARLVALPPADTLAARLARAIARLGLLVGDDLPIVPPFVAPTSDLGASFDDRGALLDDDPAAPAAWLAKVAQARPELAALERALLVADVLEPGDAALNLRVAQLPHVAGEPWIGRAVFGGEAPPSARRGFAFHAPLGLDLSQPVAGLFIDGWSEAVPHANQTTGIAFQVAQPTAAPPQLILLAVAPDLAAAAWSDDVVEQVVREAFDLAKLRLVDGDLVDDGGHYLPGLYFAINLAGHTASTDFTGGT